VLYESGSPAPSGAWEEVTSQIQINGTRGSEGEGDEVRNLQERQHDSRYYYYYL